MFAKLAKLAEHRAVEFRRAMPGAMRVIHSDDNQRAVGPTAAWQQRRRQILTCQWHSGPGDGWLECSWHIEPGDDSLGEDRENALALSQWPSLLDVCLLGKHPARPALKRRDVKG
jgi:hypothetical protein